LAGPWTVRRNRKRGRRRMGRKSPFTGGRERPGTSGRLAADGYAPRTAMPDPELIARANARYGVVGAMAATASTSSLTATEQETSLATEPPAAQPFAPGPGTSRRDLPGRGRVSPGGRRPAKPRRYSAKVAVPVLLGLAVTAIVLVLAIVGLAGLGFSSAVGTTAAASPLADPAPPEAGGLPRHYELEQNETTISLIQQFTARFAAVSGKYPGHPSALYREPGAIDPATDQPGWVMYVGYNASSDLGSPSATVSRLMASLIETTAPNTSWTADPGERGGSARCAITALGDTTVSICAWATSDTYGALMSPTSDTRGNELATLMPVMRLDLQPG
jgi:hypothetical protein